MANTEAKLTFRSRTISSAARSRSRSDARASVISGSKAGRFSSKINAESSFLKPLIEEWEKESGEKGEARGEARGLAKGEARGLAKGEARGKVAEAQAFLRGIVAARFPGIAIPAKVETMDDIEKLHALAGQALAAASREQFQATLAALEA